VAEVFVVKDGEILAVLDFVDRSPRPEGRAAVAAYRASGRRPRETNSEYIDRQDPLPRIATARSRSSGAFGHVRDRHERWRIAFLRPSCANRTAQLVRRREHVADLVMAREAASISLRTTRG
jgi:hypothetical protein